MDETVPEKPKKKLKLSLVLGVMLCISIIANVFLIILNSSETNKLNNFPLLSIGNTISIDSNSQDSKAILHYGNLSATLKNEISKYTLLNNTGVFIQDVKTGAWLGINEKESFSPASLLKIPIMMAMLKKVDNGEVKLSDKIKILPEDADNLYGEVYKKVGEEETVMQLLEQMITFSDNTAKNAIKRQLSHLELDTIFVHVGIPNPYMAYSNQTVSPRGYTRLLKALYYSTYLSSKMSEKALDLTTDTQQEQLLSLGVPSEIQVAHKFGIIDGKFLSDCGIVYHSKNPYFICVMINNEDMEENKELINKISKDTYDFVNSI
jgi:beta-lactamase class A